MSPQEAGHPNDRRWNRQVKRKSEIVLLCNPRAGGRWKELAQIFDSDEAQQTRRIVTDSVEDIAPAVANLGRDARLICMYGGDGTIQRVLDHMFADDTFSEETVLALLGGGTMNVTSRWLGFGKSPAANFRHVINSFRSGDLLLKEVPLMQIRSGERVHYGFTFGIGPIVRILDAYEHGKKGKPAALKLGAQCVAGAFFGVGATQEMFTPMCAKVTLDEEVLPFGEFATVFANVTGQINPGVEPFTSDRTRDSFHTAAYAVSAREFALNLPFIVRGLLPVDITGMLRKWRNGRISDALETDPRYVNRPASRLLIETDEPIYTVDGEILKKPDGPLEITIGPTIKLAVGPRASIGQTLKAAKSVIRG